MRFVEVGEEVGFHPQHLGRLVTYSKLFQEYLYFCREALDELYLTSAERLNNAAIERQLERFQQKRMQRLQRQRRYHQRKV
jgi:hypothetical protein